MNPNDISALMIPPHSVEAEQSLLGGLLLNNSAFERVGDLVRESDFYRDEHRRIFRCIADLIGDSKPADVVTVFEVLDGAGRARESGGFAYLGELAANTASVANIRRYAEIVREQSMLRGLIAAGTQISALGFERSGVPAADRLAAADALVAGLSETVASGDAAELTDVLHEAIALIEAASEGRGQRMGVGLTDLDRVLYDVQPGALVVIAGRPGMGKTSLCLQIIEHVAEQYGAVHFASLEMPRNQIGLRMMAKQAKVSLTAMVDGSMTQEQWERISVGLRELKAKPVVIDDRGGQTVAEIRARAQQTKRKHGGKLGAVVIDYLQLMSGDGETQNEKISAMTRALKALAKLLACPVVVLSQLNRNVEQRPNKRPVMSDLRDSGAIEQDADLILFPYRDEYYHPDSQDKGTAEIHVAKQRNGPTTTVQVAWQAESASFGNLDRQAWHASRPAVTPQKPKGRGME